MEIYFKTDLALDDLAGKLRAALNLPDRNQTPYQHAQRRVGENRGGDYYLFEAFGLSLYLLHNSGEVAIPERSECAYYLYAEAQTDTDRGTTDCLTRQIFAVMRRTGFDVTLGALAA